MDFELTDDQSMLQDSLQKLIQKDYSFDKRREILNKPNGYSPETWAQLAEQGVLGLGLPEEHGGFGGAVEIMVVMEQLGRGLVLEPFLSTVVLGGGLIRDNGNAAQQAEILPKIIAGECRIALAHHEEGARYELKYVNTTATAAGGGYKLKGKKTVVLDGAVADIFIVTAADAGGKLSLFLVDANAAGVKRVGYRTHDGKNAADVTLSDVQVGNDKLLGKAGEGMAALEAALDQANAALCAEAVGAIDAINHATVEYSKARKQFGQPIGKFQALQHRMADMFVQGVQARSMSNLATGFSRDANAAVRRQKISAAKVYIGNASRFCGPHAVQLHGGMGITEELATGHYFKRLTLINQTFGDVSHHLSVVSDAILTESAVS
ncbi:MAG: acyl-CoA dehydrogenase family protein [Candidatus Obscuribacterales bacterium]|nr:acyl-CoA dehydrogenase family protein [Steroidobacteraceae bacterium]